jgi:uncharacterized protein (TIGR03437 family)
MFMRLALPIAGLAGVLFLFPALSSGQTISISSGNGQLACPACPLNAQLFTPLVVLVKDSSGNPFPAQTVTWTTAAPGVPTSSSQSTTDQNGLASYTFFPIAPFPGLNYSQTTVTATALGSSVQFVETTVVPGQQAVSPIQVTLLSPPAGQALSGAVGQTASTLVQVQVLGMQGLYSGPIANVALQLVSGPSGPSVSCMSQAGQQPGTVFTDQTGTATCTPVFGGTIGTGTYQIVVGGNYARFAVTTLTVTAGPPAILKIISGDKQSINPRAAAPLPLVAEVDDLGGNPSPGATVAWAVVQGTGNLSNTVTTSDSNGRVSARVTAADVGGQILVQVSLPHTNAQATFTVNVNTVVTQFQIVSGNNQQAVVGTAFAQPLIVQVNNQSQPVQGAVVNFTVKSGNATLSSSSATTDAQGQAQVTVTAGDTQGQITISAAVSGSGIAAQTFSLTAVPPGPIITASGFTNAAGFQSGFISPCGLATIFGTGLATGMQGYVSSLLGPLQMAGITVQFGTANAPILSVVNENGQESVTVQVPCEVTPGTVPVTVTVGSGSTTVNVNVLTISPGLFETTMSDGKMRAVLVRPDGSFVSLENPARRGEIVRMYATGLGQTTPPLATGQTVPLVTDASGNLLPQDLNVNARVVVGVNNAGVRVVSAKYAYSMLGVYEVQFEVPADTATGNDAPFAIAVYQGDSLLFGNPSAIPIQ